MRGEGEGRGRGGEMRKRKVTLKPAMSDCCNQSYLRDTVAPSTLVGAIVIRDSEKELTVCMSRRLGSTQNTHDNSSADNGLISI